MHSVKIRTAWAIFGMVALAAAIRICGLDKYYFWGDEAVVLLLSKELTFNIFEHLQKEPHPPLYYFLLKLVMKFFGVNQPLVLRSVSWVSGILTVFSGYFLGRGLTSKRSAGLFISFLLATSPLCVEQSEVVRAYSLFLLWLVLLLFFLAKKQFRKTDFWWCGSLLLLATATHSSVALIIPTVLILGLLKTLGFQSGRMRVQIAWILLAVICLLFVWVGRSMAPQNIIAGHIEALKSATNGSPSNISYEFLKILGAFFGNQLWGIPWFAILFISSGAFFLYRDGRQDLLLLFFGPFLAGTLLGVMGLYPIVSGRHSVVFLGPALIPIAWAAGKIADRKPALLGLVVLILTLFQLRATRSIYYPDKMRWSLGEGSPKREELQEISEAIKRGDFLDRPIVMDWGKYAAVLLERQIEPGWAVFALNHQRYEGCGWGALWTRAGICKCIEDHPGEKGAGNTALILTAGSWERQQVEALGVDRACGVIDTKKILGETISIIAVRRTDS